MTVKDCLWGRSVTHKLVVDPIGAEAIAALTAVLFSMEVGFFEVIFEGDALQIVKEVNSDILFIHNFVHFIEGIKHELGNFRSSSVVHVRREANLAAHTLAKEAANNFIDTVWLEDIPSSIFGIVSREFVVPRS